MNRLSMSRKRYRRAEQTCQKPWKKRQLAQPLEGRTVRSSDHKRKRGSQQQAARGMRNKQAQVNTCIHQPEHEKKEGTGLPVSCDYIDSCDHVVINFSTCACARMIIKCLKHHLWR
ncbi:hypothetical protein CRENBAI_016134 [Crenichthys baileyi]|uniref:Uncharacterized protein n=1 Tax=Crenichthys baileyi TaxID=28760 RepID=A0AAV9QZ43_9TELE